MSSNTNDPFKTNGQNTHAGSTNQGKFEAQTGAPPSAQQPGESYTSYQTRIGAYNATKKS
ncbi:MAG: hypothetical protein AAGM21_10190 [Pseudomonadota bacterium]